MSRSITLQGLRFVRISMRLHRIFYRKNGFVDNGFIMFMYKEF